MYFASVLLLMVVLPIVSVCADHFFFHDAVPSMQLIGKWFVFWSAGVRLLLAGLWQFFKPRFTSEKIFGITSDDPLPFVRELGIANFLTGIAGVCALAIPGFVLPVALIAAIFYGIAGLRHVTDHGRSAKQNLAMITDLFASAVFAAYVISVALGA
jgi:hypothetical protein